MVIEPVIIYCLMPTFKREEKVRYVRQHSNVQKENHLQCQRPWSTQPVNRELQATNKKSIEASDVTQKPIRVPQYLPIEEINCLVWVI